MSALQSVREVWRDGSKQDARRQALASAGFAQITSRIRIFTKQGDKGLEVEKIAGSLLILVCLSIGIYVNRPRFLTEPPGKNLTPIERYAMRFLGIPIVWAISLAFLAPVLNRFFWDNGSTFLIFVFRLGLGIFLLLVGINGVIHGLFVWSSNKERIIIRLIAVIPALLFTVLGGSAIVAAYRW